MAGGVYGPRCLPGLGERGRPPAPSGVCHWEPEECHSVVMLIYVEARPIVLF